MKFFFYSILFIFFIFNNSFSKNTKLRIQDIYSDQITWKHIDFNLPGGDWIYYDDPTWETQEYMWQIDEDQKPTETKKEDMEVPF